MVTALPSNPLTRYATLNNGFFFFLAINSLRALIGRAAPISPSQLRQINGGRRTGLFVSTRIYFQPPRSLYYYFFSFVLKVNLNRSGVGLKSVERGMDRGQLRSILNG